MMESNAKFPKYMPAWSLTTRSAWSAAQGRHKAVRKTSKNGTHRELDVANTVAAAMKEWAIEKGATHSHTGSSP